MLERVGEGGSSGVKHTHSDALRGEYLSSNYLNTKSVWKSLVANCVCAAEVNSNMCFQRVRLPY